jgi:hypothetical protein
VIFAAALGLLEQAVSRQVLRQAGTVYQFRHAELQERLNMSANQINWAP